MRWARQGVLVDMFHGMIGGAMNVGHRGKEIYKSTIRKLKFCGTFWKNESHVPNRTDSYYYSVELFGKKDPMCPTGQIHATILWNSLEKRIPCAQPDRFILLFCGTL